MSVATNYIVMLVLTCFHLVNCTLFQPETVVELLYLTVLVYKTLFIYMPLYLSNSVSIGHFQGDASTVLAKFKLRLVTLLQKNLIIKFRIIFRF